MFDRCNIFPIHIFKAFYKLHFAAVGVKLTVGQFVHLALGLFLNGIGTFKLFSSPEEQLEPSFHQVTALSASRKRSHFHYDEVIFGHGEFKSLRYFHYFQLRKPLLHIFCLLFCLPVVSYVILHSKGIQTSDLLLHKRKSCIHRAFHTKM